MCWCETYGNCCALVVVQTAAAVGLYLADRYVATVVLERVVVVVVVVVVVGLDAVALWVVAEFVIVVELALNAVVSDAAALLIAVVDLLHLKN